MLKFFPVLMVLAIAGCKQLPDLPTIISPYKIDVQQGNVVTQEMIAKLKPGMSRSQVRFALGSPLIVDPFRTDRWDYVYMYQKQGRELERRRVIVIFDDDKLLRIEGDVVAQDPAARTTGKPPPKPAPAAKPDVPAQPGSASPQPDPVKPAVREAPAGDASKSPPEPVKSEPAAPQPAQVPPGSRAPTPKSHLLARAS